MFSWLDRIGNEKTIIPEESNCNQKSSVLKSDHVQITDKSALPVMKIYYGPLEYEIDLMRIVVGSLVCQPDPEKHYTIEDHINELDVAVENIATAQNDTLDAMDNHSEQINDLTEKLEVYGEEQVLINELISNQTEQVTAHHQIYQGRKDILISLFYVCFYFLKNLS